MKLIKLELLNLASLDRQGGETINFEAGALKDSTIFSIIGPMGSGKSTILDAICLALYNRAPRYPRKKGDRNQNIEIYGMVDDSEKNRPVPTDNRNILTRGKKDGYSKLTFMANDDACYRAEWSVHKATKNISDPIMSLYKITEKDGVLSEEEGNWEDLPKIIGLDYDQFLRTVLIAQGSFASFLNAKEDERYALLEKLIGCEETYVKIANGIKDRCSAAEDAYKQITARFTAVEQDIIRNPEELQSLKSLIEQLEDQKKKASQELGDITSWLNWYVQEDDYVGKIARYEQACAVAKENVEKIRPEADRLKLHDATLPAVALFKEVKSAQEKISVLRLQLNNLTSAKAEKEESHEAEKKNLQTLSVNADVAGKEYDTQKPHIDRARVIKGELSSVLKEVGEKSQSLKVADSALKTAEKAVSDNAKAIEIAGNNRTSAEQNLKVLIDNQEKDIQKLENASNDAKSQYDAENKKLEGLDAKTLQDAQTQSVKKQGDLQNAIRIRKGIAEKESELQRCNSEIQKLTSRNQEIDVQLSKLTITTLTEELGTLQRTYTLMTSENWKEHRSHLNDGEPCPLCGAIHHPYADGKAYEPVVSDLKKLVDAKQHELDEQTAAQTNLNNEKSANNANLTNQRKNIDNATNDKQILLDEWNALHTQYPDWPEASEALEMMVAMVEEEARNAESALDSYNNLVNQIKFLREAKDKAEKNLSEYKESATNDRKKAETELSNAESAFKVEQGKTANLKQQKEEKAKAKNQAEAALSQAEQTVREKQDAIKNEIGDNDPDALDKQLQETKNSADAAVEQKRKQLQNLENEISVLKGQIETTEKSQEEENTKKDKSHQQLQKWLEAYNAQPERLQEVTEDDIEKLNESTENWESIRIRQQELDSKLTAAATTLDNEKKAHEEHQKQKPTKDKENLETRKKELESLSDTELVETKARMKRHEDAVQNTGIMETERVAAETLRSEWKQISEAIGGDGKILRKIAQCYTLRFLVEHANAEIRKFNSRYELQQVKNSLGLRIIDHDRADDVRETTSLSGGETFIVSLGLALGLSSLSSRNISLQNLFIDEGFGTLDPDTLATVIDSLSMLQSSQGKKVGVISHTDTMSERITTQIRVIKNGNSGSSHIEIYP